MSWLLRGEEQGFGLCHSATPPPLALVAPGGSGAPAADLLTLLPVSQVCSNPNASHSSTICARLAACKEAIPRHTGASGAHELIVLMLC